MYAEEFADDVIVIVQALWSVFLIFGGYIALAYAGYLNPRHATQTASPPQTGAASGRMPQRFFHTGADLE